jgi:hypothetical protein
MIREKTSVEVINGTVTYRFPYLVQGVVRVGVIPDKINTGFWVHG